MPKIVSAVCPKCQTPIQIGNSQDLVIGYVQCDDCKSQVVIEGLHKIHQELIEKLTHN